MGGLRSHGLQFTIAIAFLFGITACGGHHTQGASPFAGKINLSPSTNASVQLGNTFSFTASAQNASGNNVSATFKFASSDTSVLNISTNGVACAGIWDAAFTTCTPGGVGVVQVTASAFGASSSPTYVFVHPAIDNIKVTGVLLDNAPVQEPCLSQGQKMTVQAQAFSKGVDITPSVGPFTWSTNNPSVATVTPINNSNFSFPTNQATAQAVTPGITQIFASASGVSSTIFQQPPPGTNLSFFETCPIQHIVLDVGAAGSGLTRFAVPKGTGETVVATVTDVMGNSSLPNLNNGIVLNKIPLTWTSSQPTVIGTGTGCVQTCGLSTGSPGGATVTASCSPPNCNVGFPQAPAGAIVPYPVYASTAISGTVSGAPGSGAVLATSQDCAELPPAACTVGIFFVPTIKAISASATAIPTPPNSLLFDRAGDKAYMGSNFGAQLINPSNLGTTNNAFSAIGTVTGKVLAVSPNGSFAIFSDTQHNPNQVYVVNESTPNSPVVTPLNISSASAAAFSEDNLKAYIFGLDNNNHPNLYVYSSIQALQVIPLPLGTTGNAISLSSNGAFVYVAEPSLGGGAPAISVFNTCDNQPATNSAFAPAVIPLSAAPVTFKALPDGVHYISFESNGTLDYITASVSTAPAATPTNPATFVCSTKVGSTVEHAQTISHTVRNINLNLGNSQPIDFFVSGDSTLLYVVATDLNSIVVYDFATSSVVGGIQLVSTAGGINPTPVSAGMTSDASTIVVAATDGYLHEINTANGGLDQIQGHFPDLPNYLNPFCTGTPSAGPCTLDLIAVRP